jgi:hypothetical protein
MDGWMRYGLRDGWMDEIWVEGWMDGWYTIPGLSKRVMLASHLGGHYVLGHR